MNMETKLATDLQMFRHEFATTQGADDLALRESWRRTWWTLYIVDAYYAGTLGTTNLQTMNIDATTELPCYESDYESGVGVDILSPGSLMNRYLMESQNIPPPRTLQESNFREFSPDNTPFSSFAYLIGAVQCAAFAISATPKITAEEDSMHVIQAADCSLDGWRLLLPPDRKQVMDDTSEIDELMFQAHLLIHVSTIGLHRPLSALKLNAVENVSSCAREPPLDTPTPDLVNIHTVRVLRAIEAQIRLLALPIRQFHHTPFTTCMVSEGTLAACTSILKERELAIARDQIRMTLGCLKVLGEVWRRTARNVSEIQTIAQCVLGIGGVATDGSTPDFSENPSSGEGGVSLDLNTGGMPRTDIDMAASVGSIEDLCGWYNLENMDDLPWGVTNGL